MLAPVAVEIDANLSSLRSKFGPEVEAELQLETNHPPHKDDRAERADRVLSLAVRNVDLHGWDAAIADDGSAVRLSGGSVSLDIAVGAGPQQFIVTAP